MLKLYKDSSVVKYVVGTAQNTDTIPCSEQPNEVRVFTDSEPYGILLQLNTDAVLEPNEWEWDDANSQVVLGETKTGTIVCYAGSVWLFNDTPIPLNESQTVIVELKNESNDLRATSITVSGVEIVDLTPTEPTVVEISLDGTTYANSVNVPDLPPNTSTTLHVKATAGSDVIVYRNLGVKIDYVYVFEE